MHLQQTQVNCQTSQANDLQSWISFPVFSGEGYEPGGKGMWGYVISNVYRNQPYFLQNAGILYVYWALGYGGMGFNKKAPSSKYCFHLKTEGFKLQTLSFQTCNLKLFEDNGKLSPRWSNGGVRWWENDPKYTATPKSERVALTQNPCSNSLKIENLPGNLVLNSFKASWM